MYIDCDVHVLLGLPYNGKMADIWALGVTLFCMLFGKYPFIGNTLQEVYEEVRVYTLKVLNLHSVSTNVQSPFGFPIA